MDRHAFGGLVGEPLAHQIASQLDIDTALLLPFVNLPLREFRQKAMCGNAIMRAADGGGSEVAVPLALSTRVNSVFKLLEYPFCSRH